MRNNRRVRLSGLSIIAASALALAACTPPNENPSTQTKEHNATATTVASATTSATATSANPATSEAGTAAADAEQELSFTEGVVREKNLERDMTGIFGTFHNNSAEEVTVTGFNAEGFEGAHFELHEVVNGVMQEKPSGFIIPAGESYQLVPGGDHMMIMNYAPEIPAGDEVNIVIEFSNGQSIEAKNIPVRTMNAGDEDYGHDGSLVGHHGGSGH